MQPLPPAPKPVMVTAIIKPGEILDEREVIVTIHEQGAAPAGMNKGRYCDLRDLVSQVCEDYFKADAAGEIATAELEPEAISEPA